MQSLQEIFTALFAKYSTEQTLINTCWQEIEQRYTQKKRYYHDLTHLQTMLGVLLPHKNKFDNWDALLFALFYHDAIYNVLKKDNEERSADLALKRLVAANVPENTVAASYTLILATKTHAVHENADINLFTDADLCILGQPKTAYEEYCLQIRKEYGAYRDIIYKPGRKKVITHFLQMSRIFKTDAFFEQFEAMARQNLASELSTL